MTFTKYTPEQHDVLDWFPENDGILLVEAGPGTGKSFMSREVAEALQPERCLYTAFNKAIVLEGIPRFRGLNVECKTMHALAWRFVQPKMEISDISYKCITEKIPYKAKARIIDAINMFYVSASIDMYEFMEEFFPDKRDKKLRDLAIDYIVKMVDRKINPTFNFLLKYFHLCLVDGSATCEYDLVILDEINDTTAVVLEIFKLIDAPKKLGLGETNQAIYDFLNLVNGFELLEDVATIIPLTQSFRCSEQIANRIQAFMRKDVNPDFKFIGTDEPVRNGKSLYCTGTNASIVKKINDRLDARLGFNLLRKISEIFAYPMAISTAGKGKEVYQYKYKFLEDEYKEYEKMAKRGYTWMQHLLDCVDDQETKTAVNLMLSLHRKGINLFDLYKKAKEAPVDLDYTIATVYTSKGLEFENVELSDDLNSRITKIRDNGGIQNHEDLVAFRCYYVAVSRCGVNLTNATVL
jgi:superfamily I DNA/RNA helicase